MRKWLLIITGSRYWVLVKEAAGERLWQSRARDRERSTMSEFRRIMMSSFLMLLLHFPGEDAENTHCLRLLMKASEGVFQLKSMYPWARCLTPSRSQWGTVCEWYLLSWSLNQFLHLISTFLYRGCGLWRASLCFQTNFAEIVVALNQIRFILWSRRHTNMKTNFLASK